MLPKTTPPPNDPRIGVANQTNARAVLGTVPVEKDGSAHFQAPAGKEIYFQALDATGMAVQSMRSGTYLHPGRERCARAATNANTAPSDAVHTPGAASPAFGDPAGSRRIQSVQLCAARATGARPHCVACHHQKKAVELRRRDQGTERLDSSYTNLAQKYGFYFDVGNGTIKNGVHGGSRTIAGQFGARGSKLMDYLGPKHYDVQLRPRNSAASRCGWTPTPSSSAPTKTRRHKLAGKSFHQRWTSAVSMQRIWVRR